MKAILRHLRRLKVFSQYETVLRIAFSDKKRDILDRSVPLTSPFRPQKYQVLIVRLDGIGDFVLWLDAARTLVSHYHAQGYRVVLLGEQTWASWADEMRLADEVWGLDVQRFVQNLSYRWHWSKRIRKAGFSIAIQPTFSFPRRFLSGDTAVHASGAPVRIGSVGDNISGQKGQNLDCIYTRLVPASDGPMMELKRNAEFMRALGFKGFNARLPIIPSSLDKLPAQLPEQPFAVIFSGAGWNEKAWQPSNFTEIGNRLVSHGLRIVLAGGNADRKRADEIIKELQGNTIDLVGKTSLGGLAGILRRANIVITNDSSALHIGAAVGAPVVAIMGGGHFGRFAPYDVEFTDGETQLPSVVASPMPCFGCNWNCVYPHSEHEPVKCINDVTVEAVWSKVRQVLSL